MDYLHSSKLRFIHRSDLLNMLIAVQTTHQVAILPHSDRYEQGYQDGFDAALLVMAQAIGQAEPFLAHQKELKSRTR